MFSRPTERQSDRSGVSRFRARQREQGSAKGWLGSSRARVSWGRRTGFPLSLSPPHHRDRGSMASSSGHASRGADAAVVPWVEKYRPSTLEDVAAHKDIVDTVKRLVDENKLPHLLLYGPPGTGKTSMILAIARQIYGKRAAQMCLHLNASDARGIDVVRNDIQGFASTRNISFAFKKQATNSGPLAPGGSSGHHNQDGTTTEFKLVILDECDAMTNDAQFALRRIIEKYTKNTRFCLICNYVNKVIPALQSRCTRFRFCPLPCAYVKERLLYIMEAEALVKRDDKGVEAVVKLAKGDMRRALNLVQTMAMSDKAITEENVYSCTGQTKPKQVKEIMRILLNSSFEESMRALGAMQQEEGFALVDILQDLYEELRTLGLPQQTRCDLLDSLADLEYNLSGSSTVKLQLGGLVGTFAVARKNIVEQAT